MRRFLPITIVVLVLALQLGLSALRGPQAQVQVEHPAVPLSVDTSSRPMVEHSIGHALASRLRVRHQPTTLLAPAQVVVEPGLFGLDIRSRGFHVVLASGSATVNEKRLWLTNGMDAMGDVEVVTSEGGALLWRGELLGRMGYQMQVDTGGLQCRADPTAVFSEEQILVMFTSCKSLARDRVQ